VSDQTLVPGDPLADLRDIHLPPEPPWWPPAPGWWLLALVAIAALAWAVAALLRRHRALAPRRAALRALDAIEERAAAGESPQEILAELSAVLRRFALTRFPTQVVAGQTGHRWLEFLDSHGGGGAFAAGPGACLADAPYRAETTVDPAPVIALARSWVRRCRGEAPC